MIFFLSCEKETLTTSRVYQSKDITIEFLDYTDSRCPEGLDCIWEGIAEVDLRITKNNESVNFTMTGFNSDTTIFNHNIKFLDLLPYPKEGVQTPLEEMELKLNVSKF